jgi:FAD/FMN-containing dehydrogenase
MAEPDKITAFLSELDRMVAGELRTDKYNRILYSTDASIYQVMPYGVLIPQSVEDVHAAVELAASPEQPVVAWPDRL